MTAPSFDPMLLGESARLRYVAKVRATGPIAYWTLGEASGGTAYDLSENGRNGAYTGVTLGQPGIGDGRTCPLFDGANDYLNVYSTGLRDAFNGAEGTALAWMKADPAVWSDGVSRRLVLLQADASNRVILSKIASGNDLYLGYASQGQAEKYNTYDESSTGWLCLAITWSASAGQVRTYRNGAQIGLPLTGLGTWAGTLAASTSCVGAGSTAPVNVWSGGIAHVGLWSRVLTAAEVARLARL